MTYACKATMYEMSLYCTLPSVDDTDNNESVGMLTAEPEHPPRQDRNLCYSVLG